MKVFRHLVFIPGECFGGDNTFSLLGIFIDFGTVIANQVSSIFWNKNGFLLDNASKEYWLWKIQDFDYYLSEEYKMNLIDLVFKQFFKILSGLIAYGIISILMSFVLRIGYMSLATFFLIGAKCAAYLCGVRYRRDIAYSSVPWIGIYAAHLLRSGKTDSYLLFAFVCFFGFAILFYYVADYLWIDVFQKSGPISSTKGGGYVLYCLIMELLVMIFARTRISIKYLPKLLTIFNIIFLCYVYTYFFPFTGNAVNILMGISYSTILLFIILYENPAILWNSFGQYTPTIFNPRQAYIPVPLMSYSIGFDLWTLFYPPAFRSEFSETEQNTIVNQVELMQFDFTSDFVPNNDVNLDMLLVQPNVNPAQPAYELHEQPQVRIAIN